MGRGVRDKRGQEINQKLSITNLKEKQEKEMDKEKEQ